MLLELKSFLKKNSAPKQNLQYALQIILNSKHSASVSCECEPQDLNHDVTRWPFWSWSSETELMNDAGGSEDFHFKYCISMSFTWM